MKSLFVLGDSISIQYGPYLEKFVEGCFTYDRKGGIAEALKNLDNVQGANGGDSACVLEYLRERQLNGGIEADLLLLNCGLHDIKSDPATGKKQIPISTYRTNLAASIETAREMHLEVIWVRTTPCDESIHNTRQPAFHRFAADVLDYNEAADEIVNSFDLRSIDLFGFTSKLGPDLYCDHVHFTDRVRELQAAFIAGSLPGRS